MKWWVRQGKAQHKETHRNPLGGRKRQGTQLTLVVGRFLASLVSCFALSIKSAMSLAGICSKLFSHPWICSSMDNIMASIWSRKTESSTQPKHTGKLAVHRIIRCKWRITLQHTQTKDHGCTNEEESFHISGIQVGREKGTNTWEDNSSHDQENVQWTNERTCDNKLY